MISSPQSSTIWQLAPHVSVLGGSHSSPGCTIPLPHTDGMVWHWLSHVMTFGGSRCSPASAAPSPHSPAPASIVQLAQHPSPGRLFPSSHCSPGCTIPLPHTDGMVWHWLSHVMTFGGSHCSPGSTVPSPH